MNSTELIKNVIHTYYVVCRFEGYNKDTSKSCATMIYLSRQEGEETYDGVFACHYLDPDYAKNMCQLYGHDMVLRVQIGTLMPENQMGFAYFCEYSNDRVIPASQYAELQFGKFMQHTIQTFHSLVPTVEPPQENI